MTYEDAGSQLTIHVGDEVEVTLPETATTGFLWDAEVDESALRQIGDERQVSAMPRGATGLRVIAFEAVQPGETLLRLVKRRPWESDAKDDFSVQLDVSPG